ncbi:FAD-dependent oxidoreductase [Bacillus thuringiensis]|uniref:FAD-dependent oxidoreductase n=1 Tax=Bacillus thuringiensis TaxID=1428 RepID=UPI000BFE8C91|nr:FAD-dependent oxidoreductase [Bacillus thuringiensis]PGU19080.1 FAD-dependent oxidoreductase [Bacillus thuringiensis]
MTKTYDLIIVGGGLIGLSAAYNAVSSYGGHPVIRGENVLVIEQFEFFNSRSSSGGSSRQFRYQYNEEYMAQMAIYSEYEWERLQKYSKEELISRVGSLWFGDSQLTTEGGIQPAIDTMDKLGIPYKLLNAKAIEEFYHFKNIPSHYIGFYQPDGGTINLVAALNTLFNVIKNKGVHLKECHVVTSIQSENQKVTVQTNKGEFYGKKLIIAAGPFVNELISSLGATLDLVIWDMVSAYFQKKNLNIKYPTWFVIQKPNKENDNLYYGFPEASWDYPGYMRVAPDYPFKIYDNPRERITPRMSDLIGTSKWVKNHMQNLNSEPEFISSCMIALPKEEKLFYLDFLPNNSNIVVYTSGWAAKFAPLLGKICVQLALNGESTYDINPFRIDLKQK